MKNNYLIHTKNGVKIFERDEIINNAKEQKKAGIKPAYRFRGLSQVGYLIYSTWEDGCAVVVLAADGQSNIDLIITGWQGDFVID